MILKYGAEIDKSAIDKNLNRITNQIYKLLPSREEKSDWQKPLTTIIEELAGMDRLLFDQHEVLFPLLCKLEGLFLLSEDKDFFLYRRTIFECLGLINNIKI
jgi:hypothetical protein|nr:MAG TPA: hypothetical protein [Caudoviricetes sp.]